MSGGWSAKELCERGLKVLVLERGPEIKPERDYVDQLPPWQEKNLDRISQEEIKERYFKQYPGVSYAVKESNKHFWVRDDEHPYETVEGTQYDWLRGYHTGGRSITWSRQSYRMGPQDFTANKNEGVAIDWPVRYDEIKPWYDYVEEFAGIAGNRDGLEQLPDGVYQPGFELTDAENFFKSKVESTFPGRNIIQARIAHLTSATDEQRSLGRSNCQSRNRCHFGCSFKAYFSSLNATLPAAERTGNMTIVHNAAVQSLEYDAATNRISGVRIIDVETNENRTYTSTLVFLNASAIASAMILMQSKSATFPNGLANSSDQVGRNLMDHISGAGANGIINGFENKKVFGRRPSGGIYIPRYANITEQNKPFTRGFGYQGGASPIGNAGGQIAGIGRDFKESHKSPGPWRISIGAFGEQLPNPNNRVTLHPNKTDKWGNPQALFDVSYGENEHTMLEEARKDAVAMLEAAGCTDINSNPVNLTVPGNRIHEMGSARMGDDPSNSVLNRWCQAHDVPNLFVTDGSFMTSAACQNPSISYMAFTARACDHAVNLMEENSL
ncbi:GMC family oxidoreductase [Gammaproteobacteria bacterium]|uniref:GMC family oxidoreductase n=1 Tax=OM182 bacterium MED-G28 TaxID=1986256 RepID=A0A2A5W801_9GAMM|nr:GMC family oxidoreductase [Gammaproteobacteria bacterium]PDH32417.1 MAG: GMC family oxidoreductase [OM182 bacterium MED-G28]